MSVKILAVDMDALPDATKELIATIAVLHETARIDKDIDRILGLNQERDPATLTAFFEARQREPSIN